jgi:ureidoglycolate lyase
MRTIKVEELSPATFFPFGFYDHFIDPVAAKIGTAPIEFFRDMVQQDLGGASMPSFGVCRVEKRETIIDASEYHSYTGEGILPLDNDICFHVGPATPPGAAPPLDEMRVFYAPKGTMIVLRPGVWHHAPFAVDRSPVNCLIVLPQRTYANDCIEVKIQQSDRLRIELQHSNSS